MDETTLITTGVTVSIIMLVWVAITAYADYKAYNLRKRHHDKSHPLEFL